MRFDQMMTPTDLSTKKATGPGGRSGDKHLQTLGFLQLA